MTNKKIGIFDSGVGGLSVLTIIRNKYPNSEYIYFADNKNLPYGNKQPRQILEFSRKIVNFLILQGVEIIVMGCNTSSAISLNALHREFSVPIIDIITPIAEQTAQLFQNIAVIATQATVTSNIYASKFKAINHSLKITQVPCPKLTSLIESENPDFGKTQQILEEYLKPITENPNVEALIYGCTHYPHLHEMIRSLVPSSVQILDPANFIAQHLKRFLEEREFTKSTTSESRSLQQISNPVKYFVSGDERQFFESAKRLGIDIIFEDIYAPSLHFCSNKSNFVKFIDTGVTEI